MKQTFKNYFKLGILLFGISLTLVNCQKDDESIIDDTEHVHNIQTSRYSLEDLPKVGNAIENISLSRTSNKMSTSFGDIDISDIVEYVNNDGKKSYTFKIFNSSHLQSNIDFENLHLIALPQGGYLAFILRWQPNEQWYVNNDYMFSLPTFTGFVERFDLDYNLLNSAQYENGSVILNENKSSTNRDWELECTDETYCGCELNSDYCGCNICPWSYRTGCASTQGGGVGTGDSGSGTTVGSGGTSNSNNVPNGGSSVVVEAPTQLELETEQFFSELTVEELECISVGFGAFKAAIKTYFKNNESTTMTMSGGDDAISVIPQEVIDFAQQAVDAFCAGDVDTFEEFIEVKLNEALIIEPTLLLDIDCNQIAHWQTLAQHVAPTSVQNKINSLPTGTFNDFEIQSLNGANGLTVNMDYFAVNITTLPNDPSTGNQFTAEGFLDYFRRNLTPFAAGAFPANSTFEPYCNIPSMCAQETALWNSNNPLGTLVYIDIPGDDGVVICTEFDNDYWYFQTMNAPDAGNHPVSGTRQFGYELNSNGSYNFFVRGVDRFDSFWVGSITNILTQQNLFMGADALWTAFQNNINDFVNDPLNGGVSTITPPITNRVNWYLVKDVLEGRKPISEFGCN